MPPSLRFARRTILASLAPFGAALASNPETASLLVPGPEAGAQFRWLLRLGAGLGRALPQATALRVLAVGGPDGVTAANRFATEAIPDGQHLLALAPGAAQARLLGDSRARYDPAPWLAICALAQPAALVLRSGLPRGAALRMAIAGPDAPGAAGLLALDLLGIPATPVIAPAPEAAYRDGAADAFLASGPNLAAMAQGLGATLAFAAEAGASGRDAALPETPTPMELHPEITATARSALRAGLAACRLRALVVLPSLTPADTLAAFRHAAGRAVEDVVEDQPRPLPAAEAVHLQGQLCPGPEAAAYYREWLQRRFNWRAA
ncbi:hypothetical protein [Plastoroseomonas arctica]|uniref:Uncharacterized protein n=1 Tax=Plastoroseomonas arctica TaxID=1509237 RepID=A0AAF1JZ96_9PROT|nr:hypothetical protein [Plastoroseomonas arctica]MBR0657367.1 hypothetical protein [Plastoroseomonas arctica]